ncbi:hypothetical protein [Ornithinimicrobium avium]|nr:hypothetical protein [Ornithinimicrobium avium]
MAVPVGPMFLGPLMLVFVPLWFAWFFLFFREPHKGSMHYVHAPTVPARRTQDHLHHGA